MKRIVSFLNIALCCGVMLSACKDNSPKLTVTIDDTTNGTVTVSPNLDKNSQLPEGSDVVFTAVASPGYLVDATYYYYVDTTQRFSRRVESSQSTVTLPLTKDLVVGATFIPESLQAGVNVTHDIVYAKPGVKTLKYDVYSPKGANNLPCIIIIHGGGWSMNTEEVMRGLSRDLVAEGKYVVFNIDYRWLNNGDGDVVPNTMANIIEDVYGAIAHVQEHAAEYGGDPTRIAVTGDSAGGHLSSSAANMCEMIGDGGFGVKEGVYEYKPTYMPSGKTVAQVRDEITKAIKAAAPSYGVFTEESLKGRVSDPGALSAITPINHIPNATVRKVPQYLLIGDQDRVVSREGIDEYVAALKKAGQRAELVVVEGQGHAFLDWKSDARTQETYNTVGHKWALEMRKFFDGVFY